MRYEPKVLPHNLADVSRDLSRCIERLLHRRVLNDAALDEFETARGLLESLPLSTAEFGLACGRLANAERYLQSAEHGAARFELRLLAGSFNNDDAVSHESGRHLQSVRRKPA